MKQHRTVRDLIRARPDFPPGVVAILLCESPDLTGPTLKHLDGMGAAGAIAIGLPSDLDLPETGVTVHRVDQIPTPQNAPQLLNALFAMLDGRWVAWMWAGEFLMFPYQETRKLDELCVFLADERRKTLFTYAFDLYARQMPPAGSDPHAIDLWFDRIGYRAFPGPDNRLTLFGGLGWRFEELTPSHMQQIGRPSLIRASRDHRINSDMMFGDPDYDSVSCPWHHNPTGAVMSLRRSARILAHPGFPDVASKLHWRGSEKFDWTSRQLLELGLIEPGQWF